MTSQKQLKEWFNNIVKGKNLMTPDVIKYLRNGDLVAELSEGTGFNHQPIFGLTVVHLIHKESCHDYSGCFNSQDEAIEHFESL